MIQDVEGSCGEERMAMVNRREGRRAKFSATVDAGLLDAVDRFVAEHADVTRSMVIDEALRLWAARERERAMEAQFLAPPSDQEADERAAWRQIRRAAAADQLFRRSQ